MRTKFLIFPVLAIAAALTLVLADVDEPLHSTLLALGREDVAAAIVGFEVSGSLPSRATAAPPGVPSPSSTPGSALPTTTKAPSETRAPAATAPATTARHGGLFYEEAETPEDAYAQAPSPGSIVLRNSTAYDIDVEALFAAPLDLGPMPDNGPCVLIIHTHSSEAFTMADGDDYAETDPYRTEDRGFSIVRVGDVLAERLNEYGVATVHDREIYDYPSYTGSYARSGEAIEAYLEKYPSISLVIDLHRDAIVAAGGHQLKTLGQVGDMSCAQVLLVVGTDEAGLAHPEWRENIKLALKLDARLNAMYPSLGRGVAVSRNRYNQQLTRGSLIVEIGSTGNTLREAIAAAEYFARAYAAEMLAAR